jgi:AcrR family transcriptional regulator
MTDPGTEHAPPRRIGGPGRPLDQSRDAAIRRAALEGLAELGYDRLTMDEIAARAHAGKGALYRRWPSKAALIVDAVVAWRDELAPLTLPDTGSLEGDFEAIVSAIPDFDEGARAQMAVIVGLSTAASRDPDLQVALSDGILERPRRAIRELLDRAVARGEIPRQRDIALVPDVLIGLNLLQIVLGGSPNREYVQRVLRTVVYPLVTAPPEVGART